MDVDTRRKSDGPAVAGEAPEPGQLSADLAKILGHIRVSMRHGRVHVRVCVGGRESEHVFSPDKTSGRAWLAYGRAKGDIA